MFLGQRARDFMLQLRGDSLAGGTGWLTVGAAASEERKFEIVLNITNNSAY